MKFTGYEIRWLMLGAMLKFAANSYADSKPNVVMFIADDLGYGDLGCYGNDKVQTPNIDALAEEGLMFTRMYSQPVCTPARAALLTGSYPLRHGMMRDSLAVFGPKWPVFWSHAQPGGLACGGDTFLPRIFQSKGYVNAMIGKWHLGVGKDKEHLPLKCGFNVFYGTPGTHCAGCAHSEQYRLTDHDLFVRSLFSKIPAICAAVILLLAGIYLNVIGKKIVILTLIMFCTGVFVYRGFMFLLQYNPMSCILMRSEKIIEQPYISENMTLRMTDEAWTFITDAAEDKSPFFLMMSYLQPHVPSFSSRNFENKSKLGPYYDSIMEIDWSIGVLVNTLKELGIKNNTIIIFASDNGPEVTHPITGIRNPGEMIGSTVYRPNRYQEGIKLSGEKGSLWEGGIRVPAVISWPGHVVSGSQTKAITSLMDIFPTIQEILNVGGINRVVDGKSLTPLFQDPGVKAHHDMLLHFCDMNAVAAVSYGDYKLHYMRGFNNHSCTGVMLQPPLLYNIANDPGETNPLSVAGHKSILDNIFKNVRNQETTLLPSTVSSHFSKWPRPWLFPCANFPYCHVSLSEERDFDYLLKRS